MLASKNTERRGTTPWSSTTTTKHPSNKTPPIINHHQLVENSRQSSFFVLEQKRFVLSLSRLELCSFARKEYTYIYTKRYVFYAVLDFAASSACVTFPSASFMASSP